MATSSIFHNIKIHDPKNAEAFVAALEVSEKDPWESPDSLKNTVTTDRVLIGKLLEMNHLNRAKG